MLTRAGIIVQAALLYVEFSSKQHWLIAQHAVPLAQLTRRE
jgi:hypothetical protein